MVDLLPVFITDNGVTKRYVHVVPAAQILGRPRRTVLNWAREGKIAAIKDDTGRWLVDAEAVTRRHDTACRVTKPRNPGTLSAERSYL